MYQNRIRRTSTNITPNSHPQFFIPRSEIAFDERLAFVEHICAVLLESRFGPGSVYHSVPRSSERAELEPAAFSDMLGDEPNGPVPCYALSPLGRAGYQIVEAAYRRVKQMGLVATSLNTRSSTAALAPNQGCGSP